MRILIDDVRILYAENVQLAKTLMKRDSPKEHAENLKWALQMLYFNGAKWIQLCRIDNYPHTNETGSHMHIYPRAEIQYVNLTFEEAEKRIKRISKRILKDHFNKHIDFGGD